MKPILELKNIAHVYSKKFTFKNVNLKLLPGEIVSILGKSGEGKSTLLNCIAGFSPICEGEIKINESTISKKGYTLCPENRNIGIVFQDLALFPHINVEENVSFGLKKDKKRITYEILELVDIKNLKDKYPHQISGGEQQRVALARSLARFPRLLLLDEAFAHLDHKTKEYLMGEFHKILKKLNVSVIHITHDFKETFFFADRVAVMTEGKFSQISTPWDLYHYPKSEKVLSLLGTYHMLDARIISKTPLKLNSLVGTFTYETTTPFNNHPKLIIRPENLMVKKNGDKEGIVKKVRYLGPYREYTLEYQGHLLTAQDEGNIDESVIPGQKTKFTVSKRPSFL